MSELCVTTLIIGTGGGFVVLGSGLIVIFLVTRYLKVGAVFEGWKSITVPNVIPLIILLFGIGLFVIGAAVALSDRYPSLARTIGDYVPPLIAHEDAPMSADLHDIALGDVNAKTGDSYVVRISPSAQVVKVTGAYRHAECRADLIYRIARNEPSLVVDVDVKEKILRVCTKADELPCRNRLL